VPAAVIGAELRVSERSVRRRRQAWGAGGRSGLASRGRAAQCRLDEEQLAALDLALNAAAAGRRVGGPAADAVPFRFR
jgi:hypothetical protein